ncbi:MAG: hypothetical protein HC914_08085 [Chloroflexaceae bacterium]|nr:hypothetical protein [Chloroflexaceae bacterium]
MEINNPDGNPNDRFFVTNGLLPIEMMTGQLQVGENEFETRARANIAAIGDPGNFPTYADLSVLYNRQPDTSIEQGEPVTRFLNTNGNVTNDYEQFASDPNTFLGAADPQTGYRVAQAFLNFQGQQGFVFENNQYVFGPVFDPLFVFGLPVTDAYWVNVEVAGEAVPVLFQIFERRVLTYNPANDASFRVEMGNVGQHYYQWRYGDQQPTPTATVQADTTATATVEPTAGTAEPTATTTTAPYPNP